jgi:hypothetical protein
MGGEQKYSAQLNFLDPQDLFLSGKSFAELSGFLLTGVSGSTGFFTESRSIKIENAKLNSYSQTSAINDLVSADISFGFQCHEGGGLMQKFGVLSDGAEPYYLYSSDSSKLIDSSGDVLTIDPYLYISGDGNSFNYLVDENGCLMLSDNWCNEPSPSPHMITAVDNGSSVNLTWNASNFTDYYQVQISEDGGFTYSDIIGATTTSTNYSDNSPSRGNESYYSYRVTAWSNVNFIAGNGISVYIP